MQGLNLSLADRSLSRCKFVSNPTNTRESNQAKREDRVPQTQRTPPNVPKQPMESREPIHQSSSVVDFNPIHPQNLRYTYDRNGNLITDTLGTERTTYTYNGADRMTGVRTTTPRILANQYPDQATSAAYHYDALGRRVQEDYLRTQTSPNTGGGTTERIDQGSQITFYDALGFNPIARSDYRGQTRRTIEADGTVSSRTRSFGDPSPKEVLTYAGNELVLHTGLSIYQEDARTLVGFQDATYLHQDPLGSTILTSGTSGEDRRHVHYDAFGQVLSRNAAISTPGHLYNGKPRDPMTGLVNYGFRDYDPRQGRFTTVDPIRDGTNWYGYVNGDPMNRIDFLGLWDIHGDGTATAEPGDTLSGLARQVSGNAANYTLITGYHGAPERMPVGQTVDYTAMTTSIPTNAYIVENSGITAQDVRDQIMTATKIFNSQGVPVTFATNVQSITATSSSGANLLAITVGDEAHNRALMVATGSGVSTATGVQVPLVDPTGRTINLTYTRRLEQIDSAKTTRRISGFGLYNVTTAIISNSMNRSTTAHELGHIFKVDHREIIPGVVESPSGNLMGYDRYDNRLTPAQVRSMNTYINTMPHALPPGSGSGNPDAADDQKQF